MKEANHDFTWTTDLNIVILTTAPHFTSIAYYQVESKTITFTRKGVGGLRDVSNNNDPSVFIAAQTQLWDVVSKSE